jgi:hypothetical protein
MERTFDDGLPDVLEWMDGVLLEFARLVVDFDDPMTAPDEATSAAAKAAFVDTVEEMAVDVVK